MLQRCNHITCFVQALLLSLSLCMSACNGRTEEEMKSPSDSHSVAVVFATDTTEWIVYTACKGVLYGSGYAVDSPFHIPTKNEAAILKTCSYGDGSERFVTCDGYTFGMPSSTVSKAGSKTKYSVLGLWIRRTVIYIGF